MQTIKVEIKDAFGRENIYPRCPVSELFARLVKQKTLTREDIKIIKELGFTIEQVKEEVKL